MLLNNATVFQNRQERKTIENFCGNIALHFDLSFNVERLAVLADYYIQYKSEKCIDNIW